MSAHTPSERDLSPLMTDNAERDPTHPPAPWPPAFTTQQKWWDGFCRSMRSSRWRTPQWTQCVHCAAPLLKGECKTLCCSRGHNVVPPLPPLPPRILNLTNTRPDVSNKAHKLNGLFCFTALGATEGFHHFKTGQYIRLQTLSWNTEF